MKSTAESSEASLIEPALEVRVTSFPTLKEPIKISFLSTIVTSESVSVANTVTAPPKSLFAPSRLTSESVPEVTSREVVPVTVIPSVASWSNFPPVVMVRFLAKFPLANVKELSSFIITFPDPPAAMLKVPEEDPKSLLASNIIAAPLST